jgi:penicillin-binding protein 1A
VDRRTLITLGRRLIIGALIGCLAGAVLGWTAAQALHLPQIEQLKTFEPPLTTTVLASDGSVLATFAEERRIELKPEQIPDNFKQALVAVEDAEFYEHGGVDPVAVLRAVWASIRTGRLGGGGGASTLTQQLAQNLFLTRTHSIRRKLRQMLLAVNIEKQYSKDQILTMYANVVYFGHGAYGLEAAARLFFDRRATELTLPQAAFLAGVIQNPEGRWSPIRNPEGATRRRNHVLDRMLAEGMIASEAHAAATSAPLGASLHRKRVAAGSYFVEWIRQQIAADYGTESLYTDGLTVHTTLEPTLQAAAESAVRDGLIELDMSLGFRDPPNILDTSDEASEPDVVLEAYTDPEWSTFEPQAGRAVRALVTTVDRQSAKVRIDTLRATVPVVSAEWTDARRLTSILEVGDLVLVRLPDPMPELPADDLTVELLQEPDLEAALVALDNQTGHIRAMVGGYDYSRSQFNCATQALRQCGSAFKPFVYLTAFEQGFTPADTLFDGPVLLEDGAGELTYCPKNYHGSYHGITTLRNALEQSFNVTSVKLQNLVGASSVIDTARRFGISTELHPYPSMALGAFETRLVELVRAYAGIANLGELPQSIAITELLDRDGNVEERQFPSVSRVMAPEVAYLMVHVLRGVIQRGTGVAARRQLADLDPNLAGKTGTTDNYADAWFLGFSPQMTVGVWVGRTLKDPIGRKMTGARAALPIWIRFMEQYLGGLDEATRALDFPVPAGVVFSPTDRFSGLRASRACGEVILESFLDGTEPQIECTELWPEIQSLPWPLQQPAYDPKPGELMPDLASIQAADDRITGEDEEEEAPPDGADAATDPDAQEG